MSKKEKLLQRLLAKPANFTWSEATTLMNQYGFELFTKSGGSRRKFIHKETRQVVILHRPHPRPEMKDYAMDELITALREGGFINE